jgi:hypothetical protein
MKEQSQHIAPMKKLAGADRLSISIARRSEAELVVHFPASVEMLQRVVVNGEVFHRNGSLVQIVRVAPVLYGDALFEEVIEIQLSKFYGPTAAIKDVADKYNLNYQSFKRQYYARGWHRVKRPSLEVKRSTSIL